MSSAPTLLDDFVGLDRYCLYTLPLFNHVQGLCFERYLDFLFGELSKENKKSAFEKLILMFSSLYDLKWYLIARLRYMVKMSAGQIKNSIELVQTTPLERIKQDILGPVKEISETRDCSQREAIRILNATALFEPPMSERKASIDYLQGPTERKVEAIRFLDHPKERSEEHPVLDYYEITLERIRKLTSSLKLSEIEHVVILLSTLPKSRTKTLEEISKAREGLETSTVDFLEKGIYYWTREMLYRMIPSYLSYIERDPKQCDHCKQLKLRDRMST